MVIVLDHISQVSTNILKYNRTQNFSLILEDYIILVMYLSDQLFNDNVS